MSQDWKKAIEEWKAQQHPVCKCSPHYDAGREEVVVTSAGMDRCPLHKMHNPWGVAEVGAQRGDTAQL